MGIGPTALVLYQHLCSQQFFKPGQSVMEIGSSDFVLAGCFDILKEVYRAANLKVTGSANMTAKDFYFSIGFNRYECIDLDGNYSAHKWDLNRQLPISDKFDIVTNHGTSEHVFDQCQVFRSVHELCKLSGIMIHMVPTRGYFNHGMYLYTPSFFTNLARSNKYQTIGLWIIPDHLSSGIKDVPQKNLHLVQISEISKIDIPNVLIIAVLLRKSEIESVFKTPMQTDLYPKLPSQ